MEGIRESGLLQPVLYTYQRLDDVRATFIEHNRQRLDLLQHISTVFYI